MILDTLEKSYHYESLHPLFARAFAALRELMGKVELSSGRVELGGDELFAIVMDAVGRDPAEAKLETHNKYIDIQFTLDGCDRIGWTPAAVLANSEGYDAEKDLEFYTDPVESWMNVNRGEFAVFFPDDAHAPLANTGRHIRKIVVKVAV